MYIISMEELKIYKEEYIYHDSSFNEIVSEFSPIIKGIISKYKLSYGDYRLDSEDLYQEGLIALYKAYDKFEGDDLEYFKKYAYISIKRAIWRKLSYYYNIYTSEAVSMDNEIFSDSSIIYLKNYRNSDDPKNIFRIKELRADLKKIYNELSEDEKLILKLKNQNYSYREIADQMNITTKRVDYEIQKIRKLARKRLEK